MERQKVSIYLEGEYMNSEVFINGKSLGIYPYGYSSFNYDLSSYLDFKDNNLFPWHGAYFGDIDIIGLKKPISHYRSMLYNSTEKLYMAVREPNPPSSEIKNTWWSVWPTWESWTWPEYEGKDVQV